MSSSPARMTGTSIFGCRSFEMPGHGLCSQRMIHNTFGRAYLATILPFHRFGVAELLGDASLLAGFEA